MFAALLDTSVLWPSLQRDFLLSLAVENLYRPLWSAAILEELQRHEYAKLLSRGSGHAEAVVRTTRLLQQLHKAFPEASVHGWEPLEGSFALPDRDDEHVVAAAAVGGAGMIVTANLRDFPAAKMPEGVEVLDAPEFAAEVVTGSPAQAVEAVTMIASRVRRPAMTVDEVLVQLERRYGMQVAAELLRAAKER